MRTHLNKESHIDVCAREEYEAAKNFIDVYGLSSDYDFDDGIIVREEYLRIMQVVEDYEAEQKELAKRYKKRMAAANAAVTVKAGIPVAVNYNLHPVEKKVKPKRTFFGIPVPEGGANEEFLNKVVHAKETGDRNLWNSIIDEALNKGNDHAERACFRIIENVKLGYDQRNIMVR